MNPYDLLLSQVKGGESLTVEESAVCLEAMFRGEWTVPEMVAFLEALRQKGESVSEIVGFAQTLRQHMITVPGLLSVIDLCGTGGGPPHRYNVSTATAFVLAAAGVGVAKHGNRGSRSPNGSFDFLEALGIPILTEPHDLQRLFQETSLCFLYARAHHPAVARVAEARKRMGGRTVFNLIGPLCHPGGATKQVIGVSDKLLGIKIATAAKQLGQSHVLVVAGDQGYDEITPFGETTMWEMTALSGSISETLFLPSPKNTCLPEALVMRDLAQSVRETTLAFEGRETPIARYIALNAGAGFYCAGHVRSISAGIQLSEDLLRSGEVALFLERYMAMAKALD